LLNLHLSLYPLLSCSPLPLNLYLLLELPPFLVPSLHLSLPLLDLLCLFQQYHLSLFLELFLLLPPHLVPGRSLLLPDHLHLPLLSHYLLVLPVLLLSPPLLLQLFLLGFKPQPLLLSSLSLLLLLLSPENFLSPSLLLFPLLHRLLFIVLSNSLQLELVVHHLFDFLALALLDLFKGSLLFLDHRR